MYTVKKGGNRMFDYFYGQSGEMFSYFRVPKILFRDIRFKDLSTDAKTLWGTPAGAM